MWDVRCEDTRRADPGGMLIGLLEVTPPERRQRTHVPCIPEPDLDAARRTPLDERFAELPGQFVVAPRGRDQTLKVAARPQRGLVSVSRAGPDRLVEKLLCFVPAAGMQIVDGELQQRSNA